MAMNPIIEDAIGKVISRYALVSLRADLTSFTENEKIAISRLVAAGKLIDRIYLRQKWKGNEALLDQLQNAKDKRSLLVFDLLKGPWDRVDGLVISDPPNLPVHKPEGGNFYPEDMTKEEFESWVRTLEPEQQAKAKGFYHVVKRKEPRGELYLSPYSDEYKDLLSEIAGLLKESSKLVEDESLSKFLRTRAEAFLNNEYLESEVDWLNISKESRLEDLTLYELFQVTVGPYEVYTDELFSAKSAFEFYIHARDFEFSKVLEKFSNSLQEVENNLPVPPKYKNSDLKTTPIVVVNELYAAGDVAVGPNPVTVRSRLQEYHSAIEEAKADITGLFAAAHLLKIGLLTEPSIQQFYVTYLASAFRSVRFGTKEEFVDTYGEVRKEVKEALNKLELEGIPIDIRPSYEIIKDAHLSSIY
ncbi:18819_t:CDS:2 [Racocetra fulgida]|uniref:18819_t:CDS:1 n=1 Tax=Racocetra fulgida TaxID=60492 RepID=A0A9N9B327_9GLOM|nr:18819_t:CDS:2 [Racocetra fulgida]